MPTISSSRSLVVRASSHSRPPQVFQASKISAYGHCIQVLGDVHVTGIGRCATLLMQVLRGAPGIYLATLLIQVLFSLPPL